MWAKFVGVFFKSLCWNESNTIIAVIPFLFLTAFLFCVQLSISLLILARLLSILAKSSDYLSCPEYENAFVEPANCCADCSFLYLKRTR